MNSQSVFPAPLVMHDDVLQRALDARDARFDGIFFVGIITTMVYCRPVCPARVTYPEHRRFFNTAAAAERAGYRPCLRCRPELAPGRAVIDAVPRLARVAANRIAAGALNGRAVADLARELGVSERHLRRSLEREIGVSPVELAQTHRLLLAKRLLADTALPVTRIAFASGFQSLRRFNAVFRERYRMSPSALRRTPRASEDHTGAGIRRMHDQPPEELVRLTLAYRPPLCWSALLGLLERDATPGVEVVDGLRYGRTIAMDGHCGVVFVEDAATAARPGKTHLTVDISASLLPVLMPLLARLRQLFDLDAEPTVVDAHLAQHGLDWLVRQRPGLRIPGALDGFEVALRALLRDRHQGDTASSGLVRHVVAALGEPVDTGTPTLSRLTPSAARVAEAGVAGLVALGVPRRGATVIVAIARAVVDGVMSLDPGCDVTLTKRHLMRIEGVGEHLATSIVMRALYWPDAFPASDRALQRGAGVTGARALATLAEQWRPWRAYAALHLWLHDDDAGSSSIGAYPHSA